MKVTVTYCVYHTKEVEISDEFAPLADPKYICSEEICDKAAQAVENAVGIPFDDEGDDGYIISVVDSATNEIMLER